MNLTQHLTPQQRDAIDQNQQYAASGFFAPATKEDEADYRQEARDTFQAEHDIDPTWHPIIIDECIKIINETYNNSI